MTFLNIYGKNSLNEQGNYLQQQQQQEKVWKVKRGRIE
ncbi:hypothetical protein Cabys_1361 [Caldithrix abyssi DSM 13497]|uniref:Uncharacterized protein n=1 Tax=Caldithrix abyssi DSM 13497 TaxID=880073 RepID=A0A1J1C6B8_CALAY|nr:hypothetical protein Cabys_1361 [Caldithrix abyssi DSM 13497]